MYNAMIFTEIIDWLFLCFCCLFLCDVWYRQRGPDGISPPDTDGAVNMAIT